MVNLRRWVSPQRILSVAEEQKISDPGAPLGEHTKPMFSLDGFALSSVPLFLLCGAAVMLVVDGWSLSMILVVVLSAVAMPALGFPAFLYCGKTGLWTWRGRIRWKNIRGIGVARTFNAPTGSLEYGHLVPVIILDNGGKLRWRVLRELRITGGRRGQLTTERRVDVFTSHGVKRVPLPRQIQPLLL